MKTTAEKNYIQYHAELDGVRVPNMSRTVFIPKVGDALHGRSMHEYAIQEAKLVLANRITWVVSTPTAPEGSGIFDIDVE